MRPNFGAVDLEVVDMSVPKGGAAYMFNTKRFGGVEAAFTNGKLAIDAGSVIRQERPAHVHTNWLFTAPGVYTMKVRAKAWPVNRSADAQPLVSKVVTYSWLVGSSTEIEEPNPQPEPEGPRPGPVEPSAPVPPAAPAPNAPENRVTDASAANSAQAGTQVQKDTPAKGAETPKGSALASTGTAGVASSGELHEFTRRSGEALTCRSCGTRMGGGSPTDSRPPVHPLIGLSLDWGGRSKLLASQGRSSATVMFAHHAISASPICRGV